MKRKASISVFVYVILLSGIIVISLIFCSKGAVQTNQINPSIETISKTTVQSIRDANDEIYIINSDGSNRVRLTNNALEDGGSTWSPFIQPTSLPAPVKEKLFMLIEVEKGRDKTGVDGLNRPSGVTVSTDGNYVYVAGNDDDAIAMFKRNINTGFLTFVRSYFNDEDGITGLDGPSTILISPDGNHLYVTNNTAGNPRTPPSNIIVVFNRNNSTGELTFIEDIRNGEKGVSDLNVPIGIAISPNGSHIYVINRDGDNLMVFSRDSSTGVLTFVEVLRDNTSGIDGLDQASYVIISPDGKHVYVTSQADDAVGVFSRNEDTGKLTFVELQKNRVNGVSGLNGAFNILGSPGGAYIYVTGAVDDAVTVFSRNSDTGVLTFIEFYKNGVNGVFGIDQPLGITISADGNSLYVAGTLSDAIAVFSRDSNTGKLKFIEMHENNVGNIQGLDEIRSVTVSPDGAHLFVTGRLDDALVVFERNSNDGKLTFLEVHTDGGGLEGTRGITISPDGKYIYASSYNNNSVTVFQRESENGELSLIETHRNGINGIDGLDGVNDLTLSPEGNHLYVTGINSDAVVVFERNINSGKLSFVEVQKNGVNGVEGLYGAVFIDISPDGKHIYVTGVGDDAVAVFNRDLYTGKLTFIEKHQNGVNGVNGIDGALGVKVSPDGKNVYVNGSTSDAIAVFNRNVNNGRLTFVEFYQNNKNGVEGLDGGSGNFSISSDGKYLYALGFSDNAVVVFNRNTETGKLNFVEVFRSDIIGASRLALSPDESILYVSARNKDALALFNRDTITGKLSLLEIYENGIEEITGLDGADGIVVSPDGSNIYITSRIDNAITVLKKK